MNQNSFQIKGWMITIISALLDLYASSENTIYIFIAIVPAIVFWFLDAYYLQQERKFRGVYNDVAGLSSEDSRLEIKDFEMPIQKYQCGKYCYFNVLFSKTIFCKLKQNLTPCREMHSVQGIKPLIAIL